MRLELFYSASAKFGSRRYCWGGGLLLEHPELLLLALLSNFSNLGLDRGLFYFVIPKFLVQRFHEVR